MDGGRRIQDVMNLEGLPKKSSRKQLHDNHSHNHEDQEKITQQNPLEQFCFPATTKAQAGHLLDPGLKSAPRGVPKSARQALHRPGHLRSPSRSRVYLIIGLQNELTKCGILKNMNDYEEFWKLIQEEANGTEIKEKLQKIKVKMLDPRYWPLAAHRRRETRSLVSANQDNWPCQKKWVRFFLGINTVFCNKGWCSSHQTVRKPLPLIQLALGGGKLPTSAPASAALHARGSGAAWGGDFTERIEIDFSFKQIQTSSLEPVPCPSQAQEEFQQPAPRDLVSQLTEWRKRCQHREPAGKHPQGQEENQMASKMNKKDSRSKIYLRRLHQMYSTSLANMEFSRRLLEKDGRFADVHIEGRAGGLKDYMILDEHREPEEAMPRETEAGDPLPAGQQPHSQLALTFLKCWSSGCTWRDSSCKTSEPQVTLCGMLKHPKHRRSDPDPPRVTAAPDVPAPLTLEHMTLTHRVVEAKTGRRYWINYVDEE
nr:uncharacterized protein LOC101787712 [Cavia porcellus]